LQPPLGSSRFLISEASIPQEPWSRPSPSNDRPSHQKPLGWSTPSPSPFPPPSSTDLPSPFLAPPVPWSTLQLQSALHPWQNAYFSRDLKRLRGSV
jgi:hypothetical protein